MDEAKLKDALKGGVIWGGSGLTAGAVSGKITKSKKTLPLALIQGGAAGLAGVLSSLAKKSKPLNKKANTKHDLVFYENRSTPQVLPKGAEPKVKKGYGKITKRRSATDKEENIISTGKWLRVDEQGNKPSSGSYKKTKYRPQLVKSAHLRETKNKTKMDKAEIVFEKLAGHFENLKGYSSKDDLIKDIKTVRDRKAYKFNKRKDIVNKAPKKEITYTTLDKDKLQKRDKIKDYSRTSRNIAYGGGAASAVVGNAGIIRKSKKLRGLGVGGAVGALGTYAVSKYLSNKAKNIDTTKRVKKEVPDVDWSKVKPKLDEKAKKKFPSSGGTDFGMLGKYVGVSPNVEYEKTDKGKYQNIFTGQKYDKPYITKDDLRRARKTFKGLDNRTDKVIDKALESDKEFFTSTKSL